MKKMAACLFAVLLFATVMASTGAVGQTQMAPDGSWVGGRPEMAPDGSWVGGRPKMAPDGSWVGMSPGDPLEGGCGGE